MMMLYMMTAIDRLVNIIIYDKNITNISGSVLLSVNIIGT